MECCVYCIALCLITLPLYIVIVAYFSRLQYVHDSPAHLYMRQLFTHCLPAIVCGM